MTLPSQNVRRPSVAGRHGPFLGFGPVSRRLLEVLQPWLIVALILLFLGLAGGVETGRVWP